MSKSWIEELEQLHPDSGQYTHVLLERAYELIAAYRENESIKRLARSWQAYEELPPSVTDMDQVDVVHELTAAIAALPEELAPIGSAIRQLVRLRDAD